MSIIDRYRSYPRSSPREKAFAAGILLAFVGLGGIVFLNLHGILRIITGFCLVIGVVVHNVAFFVGVWDRNPVIRKVTQSPDGVLWLRIVATLLWLGVLPFACLWVYHRVHQP